MSRKKHKRYLCFRYERGGLRDVVFECDTLTELKTEIRRRRKAKEQPLLDVLDCDERESWEL